MLFGLVHLLGFDLGEECECNHTPVAMVKASTERLGFFNSPNSDIFLDSDFFAMHICVSNLV